jgi:predicted transglutaminase-like protease
MKESPSVSSSLWLDYEGERVRTYKYSRCKDVDAL